MTTFPLQTDASSLIGNALSPVASPAARRFAIDSVIEAERERTPQSALEQRAAPRFSIAELNAADFDEIRRRFEASRYDGRSPVVRALDLIDLPRNAVANLIFRGTSERKAEMGDRATLGLPRVNFSDALDSMGVENRIVRGVVGFVGDVALDPLTYLSAGSSAALTAAGKGGSLTIGKAGAQTIRRSAREAARAGSLAGVGSREGVNLLRGLGFTDEGVAALREGVTRRLAEGGRVAADKAVRRETERELTDLVTNRLYSVRPEANDPTRVGFLRRQRGSSPLVDLQTDLDRPAAARAVGDFVSTFQRGSVDPRSGFRGIATAAAREAGVGRPLIGIPGTDISVRIGPSPSQAATARLARAAGTAGSVTLAPEAMAALDAAREAGGLSREAAGLATDAQRIDGELAAIDEQIGAAEEIAGRVAQPPPARPVPEGVAFGETPIANTDIERAVAERMPDAWASMTGPSRRGQSVFPPRDERLRITAGDTADRLLVDAYTAGREGGWAFSTVDPATLRPGDRFTLTGKPAEVVEDGGSLTVRVTDPGLVAIGITTPKTYRITDFDMVPVDRGSYISAEAVAAREAAEDAQSAIASLRVEREAAETAREAVMLDLRAKADALRERRRAILDTAETIDRQTGGAIFSAADVVAQAKRAESLGAEAARLQALADEQDAIRAAARLIASEPGLSRRSLDLLDDTQIRAVRLRLADQIRGRAEDAGSRLDPDAIEAQADEALRQYRAVVESKADAIADLVNASDAERRAFEMQVDALHAAAEAHFVAAAHAKRPLYETARLTGRERVAAEVAKRVLRTDSDEMGTAIIAPFSAWVRSVNADSESLDHLADGIDSFGRAMRRTFGNRAGLAHDEWRQIRGAATDEAREATLLRIRRDFRRLDDIAEAHEIPDAARGDLGMIVTALMIARRNAAAGMRGLDAVPYPKEFNGVEEAWVGVLRRANETLGEAARADLNRLADEYLGEMDRLGAAAAEDGLNDLVREFYIPNVSTPQFQRAADTLTARRPGGGGGRSGTQPFQRMRTTDQVRISMDDPDVRAALAENPALAARVAEAKIGEGEEIRFFVMDMAWRGRDLSRINPDAYSPQAIDGLRRAQAAMDLFDAMPEAWKAAHAAVPTDPLTINAIAADRLRALHGAANLPRGAFETNAAVLTAQRWGQQRRAAAMETARQIVREHGAYLNRAVLNAVRNAPAGSGGRLPNGRTWRVVSGAEQNGLGVPVLEIGGVRYRELRPQYSDPNTNPLVGAYGDVGDLKAVIPERVAEDFERLFDVANDPEQVRLLADGLDKVTGAWKTATLAHASWLIGNVTGNTWLAGQAGVEFPRFFENVRRLIPVFLKRDRPDGGRAVYGGVEMDAADIVKDAVSRGVAGGGRTRETSSMLRGPDPILRIREGGFLGGAADRWQDTLETVGRWEWARRVPHGQKLVGAPVFVGRQAMAGIEAWFRLNQTVDDVMRTAVYATLREQGFDEASATARTLRNLYDYTDLTQSERWLRRLFPFYAWMRNSMPHQTLAMLRTPAYAGLAPKSVHALDQMLAGEDSVPQHLRPMWMREQMAIQVGRDPDSRFALNVGTLMPQEATYRLLAGATGAGGLMDNLNFLISSTSPLVRAPAELALGREFFTDRTIGADRLSGDLSVYEYLVGQVRPARELGWFGVTRAGAIPAAFERGVGQGIGRSLIGGRAQPFDDERIRFNLMRELNDAEQGIRRAIRLAEREGRTDLSQAARAELLLLYGAAIDRGLASEVPKWAQRQLAEIGVPTPPDYDGATLLAAP